MIIKRFIVFLLCIVTMTTGLVGCSSGVELELSQKEFSGISFKIPSEWGEHIYESNDNITYAIPTLPKTSSIFYIYTFPKETYKSKFYDEESNTYKGFFELSSEKKLKNKLNLMVFNLTTSTEYHIERSESEPLKMFLLALVETDEHVLEVTMDISEDYFENNKELIHSIYNSIKIN